MMQELLDRICGMVWGGGLMVLLLGTGLICTVKLRFVQLRMIPYLARAVRRGRSSRCSGITQLRTVCMSLGTAMGTGNITGVSAALIAGGPGAVLWMWISAALGMALVYGENVLSVKYSDDDCRGPMAYLRYGLRSPVLAAVFAVFCAAAACGMGGMVQVSSVANSVTAVLPISRGLIASLSFLMICAVVSGGARRIGAAAQALLPAASVLYVIACTAVLVKFRSELPGAVESVVTGALGLRPAAGGAAGYAVSRAVSVGLRRGVFSNEAGLGSSPILHSAAESDSPELQGMCAMFEVFFDTFVCCTLTALTLLCSGEVTAQSAFLPVLGRLSAPFVALEMTVFAFCTVIGWYYCGETAVKYLAPRLDSRTVSIVFSAFAALGAVFTMHAVWTLSDIFNGLMAFPNLAGLLLLMKHVKKE